MSTNNDPLDTEFVRHVLRYRPDGVTARLAREVKELRREQTERDARWRHKIKLLEGQLRRESAKKQAAFNRAEQALSECDKARAEVKKVEAFQAQAIEHQADVVAYRHDIEVAEYERDEAQATLEALREACDAVMESARESVLNTKRWVSIPRSIFNLLRRAR